MEWWQMFLLAVASVPLAALAWVLSMHPAMLLGELLALVLVLPILAVIELASPNTLIGPMPFVAVGSVAAVGIGNGLLLWFTRLRRIYKCWLNASSD